MSSLSGVSVLKRLAEKTTTTLSINSRDKNREDRHNNDAEDVECMPDIVQQALAGNMPTAQVLDVLTEHSSYAVPIGRVYPDNISIVIKVASLCKRRKRGFIDGGERYATILDELASESIWLLYIAAYSGIEAALNVRSLLNSVESEGIKSGEIIAEFRKFKDNLIGEAGGISVNELSTRVDADKLTNRQLLNALSLSIKK